MTNLSISHKSSMVLIKESILNKLKIIDRLIKLKTDNIAVEGLGGLPTISIR